MLNWFLGSTDDNLKKAALDQSVQDEIEGLMNFLLDLVNEPNRPLEELDRARQISHFAPEKQLAELPGVYLSLEQFAVEINPRKQIPQKTFRHLVAKQFPHLQQIPSFALIFLEEEFQRLELCRRFLQLVCNHITETFGQLRGDLGRAIANWIAAFPKPNGVPAPLGFEAVIPGDGPGRVAVLGKFSKVLYDNLAETTGHRAVGGIFEKAYQRLAELYAQLGAFPVIISLIPDELMTRERLVVLSRFQREQVLQGLLRDARTTAESFRMECNSLRTDKERLEKSHLGMENAMMKRTRELQESNELLVAEISNRQRAEMALSVEKECRAVALASVAEGIFFLDGDGFVTFVNPKAEQLLNYDPNRAIGKKLDDVLSLWDHDGEKVELMILSGDPGVARGGSRMLFLENSKKEKVLVSLLWAPVVAGPRNSKAAVVVIRELRSA